MTYEYRRDDSALAHLNQCVTELANRHGSVMHLQANINAEIGYLSAAPVEASAEESVEESKVWHTRTMKDVRVGDMIKPVGENDALACVVADRYWPADPTEQGKRSWHVVEGEKHWDDRLVREGDVCIKLSGAAEPVFMRADFSVDIQLTPTEIAAIELLGWDNRWKSLGLAS